MGQPTCRYRMYTSTCMKKKNEKEKKNKEDFTCFGQSTSLITCART